MKQSVDNTETTINVQIKPKNLIQVSLVLVGLVILLSGVYVARHALSLIVISIFLALALNTPVNWISQYIPRRNRVFSTLIAYMIVVVIVGGFIAISAPPIIQQTKSLINNFPGYIDQVQVKSQILSELMHKYQLESQANKLVENTQSYFGDYSGLVFGAMKGLAGGVISLLTVFVLTFLMLIDGPELFSLFWSTYGDKKKRLHHQKLASKMYGVITGFVNGQVAIATIDAIGALILMLILRQPYAFVLAGLIWITGLIPLIGATLGAVVVVVVAFLHSPINALILAIYFPVYQLIENHSIQPYVQSKALNMSALLVFSSVIIGYSFGGLLPALLALPVAGCIKVLVVDYFERRHMLKNLV